MLSYLNFRLAFRCSQPHLELPGPPDKERIERSNKTLSQNVNQCWIDSIYCLGMIFFGIFIERNDSLGQDFKRTKKIILGEHTL